MVLEVFHRRRQPQYFQCAREGGSNVSVKEQYRGQPKVRSVSGVDGHLSCLRCIIQIDSLEPEAVSDFVLAKAIVVLHFGDAFASIPTTLQCPGGHAAYARRSEGYSWVYHNRTSPAVQVPYKCEPVFIIELVEAVAHDFLPSDLALPIGSYQAPNGGITLDGAQVEQHLVALGQPGILSKGIFGLQHLGCIIPGTADALQRDTEITKCGYKRYFDQFKIGQVLPS